MVGMFMIDKFFCGFFIGVILYFLIFESIINLQTPLLRYEINFLQRLADQMEALGEAVVDRRPSSVTDITDLNRDLEFHNDMISQEGQSLKDTITISCYVIISGNCKMAATAINNTWGRRCNHIRFLVTMRSKTCGLPVLYLKNTKVKEKYQEAISKIYNVYGNESDWTLVATDDTYMIMENIRFLINRTAPDSKAMYGYITDFSLSRKYPRMYDKYSSVMLLTRAAMNQYTLKSRVVACPSSSTSYNMYDLLCMKKIGISYEVNGSKSLNVVPPELRISLPTKLIKEMHKFTASFRYVNPRKMSGFEFLVYHLRPYGAQ